MKILYIIFFSLVAFSQNIDYKKLQKGKRGSEYRVWIYFKDKVGSNLIIPSSEAVARRKKNNVFSDGLWKDLKVSPSYINQIQSLGIEIKNESRWLNAISVICSESELNLLLEFPFVEKIEPVIGYKKVPLEKKNDINPNSRDYDYGNAQAQIEQINVHELHNQGFTGNGIRILVLDTGFDLTHNALVDINVIDQFDVINDDNQTANETESEEAIGQDSHGTAVLSTIAANAPGELIGVAFDAEFLLAKTEDVSQEIQQEEDDYVSGLEWGESNGADVSSSSLGYLDWYEYSDMDGNSAITTIAIDIAVGLGMVCVTAAGNSGNSEWYYIIAPADADSVISVGAVSENGEIASFSSHGPTVDGRIKPEVCARGSQTWCISPNSTINYTQYSGTSLSCPLVAGVVGLVIQAKPNWTAMEVRNAIMMTASMADSANNTYGYGIVDALAAIDYGATNSNLKGDNILPNNFYISEVYPNPFNPSVSIQVAGKSELMLKLDILSYRGQFIMNLYDGKMKNDVQPFSWNPESLPSGVYIIHSNINGHQLFKKVTYLK